ncbi:MAG: hypothetical protein ACK56W_20465, partial [Pirellula sp.]
TSTGLTKVDSARDVVSVRSKIRNNSAITPKRGLNLYRLNSAKNTTTIRPVTDTGLVRKPACESTRRQQSDEQNIEYNPSATACNGKSVGCWRMENT